MIVEPAVAGDRARWDRFVESAPGGGYCYLYGWKRVFENAYGKRCEYLYAHADGAIVGILPLVKMKPPLGPCRLVSLPFLDRAGILARSTSARDALLRAALELAGRLRARGLDLRDSAHEPSDRDVKAGRYRLILPLSSSEEALWQSIGGKTRNQVRKADKNGLITIRVGDEGLPEFYRVFARNMRDLGSPVHSYGFFQEVLSALGEWADVYLTRTQQCEVVAAGISVRFGDTVTVPWASSLRSARSDCPNHSLYWRVLRDSIGRAVDLFDFGRSTAGTGTFHFKKQWGAKAVALDWRSLDCNGGLTEQSLMDPRKHSTVVGIWSRLPVALANRLGPLVRRHLAN